MSRQGNGDLGTMFTHYKREQNNISLSRQVHTCISPMLSGITQGLQTIFFCRRSIRCIPENYNYEEAHNFIRKAESQIPH